MEFSLMYITNNPELAVIAENAGVDWIFIDLEINGKVDRQGHLDTVISRHSISDVKKIKSVLNNSKLLVRVNPIYGGSKEEIDRVIHDGADIVMLPFFKNAQEVREFIKIVNYRAKTCLLLETKEAVKNLDEILNIEGIDYIHIGLNDLHLSYELDFMFELLSNGKVEMIIDKIKQTEIKYGFGGIAKLGKGDLPPESILTEHIRVGSSMAILSRSFYNNDKISDETYEIFKNGVSEIRSYLEFMESKDNIYFEKNKQIMHNTIDKIVRNKRDK